MDEELLDTVKQLGRQTEVKLTRALLKWKYKREGRPQPPEPELAEQSRRVADQAHTEVARAGRSLWRELKDAYARGREKKEDDGKT